MKNIFSQRLVGFLLFAISFDLNAAPRFIKPDPARGTSLAVVAENVPLAHTTQFLPLDENGKLVGKGNAKKQIERTLKNLDEALKRAESSLDRIVKINVMVAKEEVVAEVEKVFAKKFKKSRQPRVLLSAVCRTAMRLWQWMRWRSAKWISQ